MLLYDWRLLVRTSIHCGVILLASFRGSSRASYLADAGPISLILTGSGLARSSCSLSASMPTRRETLAAGFAWNSMRQIATVR